MSVEVSQSVSAPAVSATLRMSIVGGNVGVSETSSPEVSANSKVSKLQLTVWSKSIYIEGSVSHNNFRAPVGVT